MSDNQSTVHDYADYEMVGNYVIRVHRNNPFKALAMNMKTGARRKFSGETCLQDATRWASDRYWKEGML